ncbi:hypothetical protein FA15DRAFT_703488 [Coprinopsis marcescibilis]|uniref:Uncharacterized protein n=1 Tax=Coprinopsis marcescibilis TaxID=230819 RepID=A0A5C3KZ86_COPMA|nr:hypothetical protein FA15DRAFT_703488 [Coprinopsis marcescibilis]
MRSIPTDSRALLYKTLALVVFGTIGALAPGYIYGSAHETDLMRYLHKACVATPDPAGEEVLYRFDWFTRKIGVEEADQRLCAVVTVFQLVLLPSPSPTMMYFFLTHAPLVLLPMVEGMRRGARFLVWAPMLLWFLAQVLTIGATAPWYWIALILTSGWSGSGPKQAITRRDAQVVAASFVLGGIIPFVAMIYGDSVLATILWQFFPVLISIAGYICVAVIPKQKDDSKRNGYPLLKKVYTLAFIAALTGQKYARNPLQILDILQPASLTISAREATDIFLKWDLVFGYGVFMLGSCWFARNAKELVILVGWNVVGGFFLGPGAVLALTGLWRERTMVEMDDGEKEKST